MSKILNMKGEDISPVPLTLEEKFAEELMILSQKQLSLEIIVEKLFEKYKIKLK